MAMYGTFGGPASMFGGSLYNPTTGAESRDYVPLAPNDPRVTGANPGNMNYLGGSPTFNERNPGATYPGFGQPITQGTPTLFGGDTYKGPSQTTPPFVGLPEDNMFQSRNPYGMPGGNMYQGPSQGMTGQNPFRNPYRQQNPFVQQPPMQTGQYQGGFGQQPSMGGIGSLFGGMGGYGMGYNPMQSMYGNPYMSSYGMGFNPMMGMYGMGNYNPYMTMMAMGGFNPFAGQQNVFSQNSMGVPYGAGTLPTSRPEQPAPAPATKPLQIGPAPAPAPVMPPAQQAAAQPARPTATAPAPAPAQQPSWGGVGPAVTEAQKQKYAAEQKAVQDAFNQKMDAYTIPQSSPMYQASLNPEAIPRMSGESVQDALRRLKGQAMELEERIAWRQQVQNQTGGNGFVVTQMAKGGLTSLLNKFRK